MGTLHIDNFSTPSGGGGGLYYYDANSTILVTNEGDQTAYINTPGNFGASGFAGFPIYPHTTVEFQTGSSTFLADFASAASAADVPESPSTLGPIWVAGLR